MEIPLERYAIFHELFYTRLETLFCVRFYTVDINGNITGDITIQNSLLLSLPMIHLGKFSNDN